MNYLNKVCSFTGYRTPKLNACLATNPNLNMEDVRRCLKSQMLSKLEEDFTTFQCGMALGADLMFAQIALELREMYSAHLVKFVAVIPCLEHDKSWSQRERSLCRDLIRQADETVLVSDCRYFDGCMAKRNQYLVKTCDELLAVYDGQRGGTMQTVNFAKGKGIKVTVIDPSKSLIITLRESIEETYRKERSILF